MELENDGGTLFDFWTEGNENLEWQPGINGSLRSFLKSVAEYSAIFCVL